MGTVRQFRVGISVQQVSWFPDGRRLFVLGWADGASVPEVGVVNSDGSNYEKHMSGIYGGILASPTDSVIAMTSSDEFILYHPDTRTAGKMKMDSLAGQMGEQDIAWSPNGEYLALEAERTPSPGSKVYQLIILNKEGQVTRRLEAPKSFSTVSWNWLSNTVAYWGGDNPGVTFRKITGEPLRYIPSASKAIFNPQQDAVVYLDGAKAPDYELVIEHGKKRSIVDVFSFKDRSLYPPNHTIWSPDGKKLLFDSYSRVGLFKSERAWMIYDLESRKLRRLMEKGRVEEKFRFPVWFPDSKSIAFVVIGEFEVAVYTL